jgi:predicted RNA-binding Zn-ribbon protein involved in translation (DUF1610 family)
MSPQAALSSNETPCPRCGSQSIERLVRVERAGGGRWFRCDHCGHLFTRDPDLSESTPSVKK